MIEKKWSNWNLTEDADFNADLHKVQIYTELNGWSRENYASVEYKFDRGFNDIPCFIPASSMASLYASALLVVVPMLVW